MHYLITSEQLNRIKKICETSRNKKILAELEALKPFDGSSNSVEVINYLQLARDAKANKLQEKITNAINRLKSENKPINAYQVHKLTNIAYITLKKHLKVTNA